MAETDAELQLRVWKELAISKQILMRTATDVLGLDPDTSPQELKAALEVALQNASSAAAEVGKARAQASAAVAEMEQRLAEVQKKLTTVEAARDAALASQHKLEQQVVELRASSASEVERLNQRAAQKEKELQERLAQKERELKGITTALSDTPQNVVKKLKDLKKQKDSESDARKRAEETANTLLRDKKKLEQTVKEMEAAQENAAKLAAGYRELHTLCGELRDQLKPLVENAEGLPAVPPLATALLDGIEKVGAAEEKKAAGKGKR